MSSAFVGYEELSRSQRVLSTSAFGLNTLLDLLNSSYPTQADSLVANDGGDGVDDNDNGIPETQKICAWPEELHPFTTHNSPATYPLTFLFQSLLFHFLKVKQDS